MPLNSVTVKRLTLNDVLPLVRICNQAFLEWARFPEHGVEAVRRIQEQPQWQWGAFEGERLRGFLLCNHRREKKSVAIKLIGVDPAACGRGLGRMLLETLDRAAVQARLDSLSVGTPFAAGFYRKNGFELAGTNLRMIRDIAQSSIRMPEGLSVRPMGMGDAQEMVGQIQDDGAKSLFLKAFLAHYRKNGRLLVRMDKGRQVCGTGLGEVDRVYGDFVRVALALPIHGSMEDVVRGMETMVSMQGLRHIGFELAEEQETLFSKLGYERAARDYFWTMYTLRKTPGVRSRAGAPARKLPCCEHSKNV